MSEQLHNSHDHHDHHDGHGHDDHGHHDDAPHSSFSGYMIGFMASVILTAIPFWLVMGDVLGSKNMTVVVILAFAMVQIVVHMVYFLHMNFHSEGGWNMLALMFTVVLLFITLSGSLWVMYHMNVNMMPGMMGTS